MNVPLQVAVPRFELLRGTRGPAPSRVIDVR